MNATDVDVLVLGTTHFADHADRVLSDRGQAEIADVVDQLVDWAPTRVAVEIEDPTGAATGELYARWQDGGAPLPPNEAAQLAARVARRLGHRRLYPVDVQWPFYDDDVERLVAADDAHRSRWSSMLAAVEADVAEIHRRLDRGSIGELLAHLNSPAELHRTLALYYDALLGLADGDGAPGPVMIARWYDRNIRIAGNVAAVAEDGDRILIVYGVGHAPLLRHCFAHLTGWRVHDHPAAKAGSAEP